jgi:hypothetical protein
MFFVPFYILELSLKGNRNSGEGQETWWGSDASAEQLTIQGQAHVK